MRLDLITCLLTALHDWVHFVCNFLKEKVIEVYGGWFAVLRRRFSLWILSPRKHPLGDLTDTTHSFLDFQKANRKKLNNIEAISSEILFQNSINSIFIKWKIVRISLSLESKYFSRLRIFVFRRSDLKIFTMIHIDHLKVC